MKAITLQNFEIPDSDSDLTDRKKYRVFLFWERRVKFTDRKKMLSFLAGASKELTYSMVEITQVSKDLFALAADGFVYFENWNGDEIHSFNTIFNSLNRACNSTGANSHAFIFKHMYDSLIALEHIAKRLNTLYRQRNQFLQVKQIDIMLNRISEIRARIDRIGIDS